MLSKAEILHLAREIGLATSSAGGTGLTEELLAGCMKYQDQCNSLLGHEPTKQEAAVFVKHILTETKKAMEARLGAGAREPVIEGFGGYESVDLNNALMGKPWKDACKKLPYPFSEWFC